MATDAAQSLGGGQPRYRRGGPFVLTNLSIGHGFTHWYGQSIVVLLPVIQTALGFTNFQFGSLIAILSISGGIANIPTGFVVDIFRRRWGLILTLCMAVAAVGYGLVAASPGFVMLALVFILLPLPGTLAHAGHRRHLPAVPEQAGLQPVHARRRRPDWRQHRPVDNRSVAHPFRRGVATRCPGLRLSRGGDDCGRVLGPVPLGGDGDDESQRTEVGQRFRDAGRLLRNPAILALVLVSSLRTWVQSS